MVRICPNRCNIWTVQQPSRTRSWCCV